MRGGILEAYCALAKADCFLSAEENERNERKIESIRENIRNIQKAIYALGHEDN